MKVKHKMEFEETVALLNVLKGSSMPVTDVPFALTTDVNSDVVHSIEVLPLGTHSATSISIGDGSVSTDSDIVIQTKDVGGNVANKLQINDLGQLIVTGENITTVLAGKVDQTVYDAFEITVANALMQQHTTIINGINKNIELENRIAFLESN